MTSMGVLGLAPLGRGIHGKMLDDLFYQGLIATRAFGLAFPDASTSLLSGSPALIFGGIDTYRYSGRLQGFDIVTERSVVGLPVSFKELSYYSIVLDRLHANFPRGEHYEHDKPVIVTLDSGSPETTLPSSFVDLVAAKLSRRVNFTLGQKEDLLIMNCTDPLLSTVTIGVTFGNMTVNVPILDFGIVASDGEQCSVLLRKSSYDYIIGANVFKYFYSKLHGNRSYFRHPPRQHYD